MIPHLTPIIILLPWPTHRGPGDGGGQLRPSGSGLGGCVSMAMAQLHAEHPHPCELQRCQTLFEACYLIFLFSSSMAESEPWSEMHRARLDRVPWPHLTSRRTLGRTFSAGELAESPTRCPWALWLDGVTEPSQCPRQPMPTAPATRAIPASSGPAPSQPGAHCNKKPVRVPLPWLPHPCARGPCPGILQAKPGDFKSLKSNSVPQLPRSQPTFRLAQAGTGGQHPPCLRVPGSPRRGGEGAPLHERRVVSDR